MTTRLSHIRRIAAAVDAMESNLSAKLGLDGIARAAHCSPYHFHRLFSSAMGVTVHGYLQRRRLTEAAKTLVDSEKPIIHIALEAGYESQQAFAAVFAAMYKQPPNQFRKRAAFYPLQWPIALTGRFDGLERGGAPWSVVRAGAGDARAWMDLVRIAVGGFPCLRENEHLESFAEHVRLGRALMVRDGETAVGGLLFSPDSRRIDFLAAHPLYRETGVAEAMIGEMLADMPKSRQEVGITTYRENDRADPGQRRALLALGFAEAEPLTEFGYPTQRFVIKRLETRTGRGRKGGGDA